MSAEASVLAKFCPKEWNNALPEHMRTWRHVHHDRHRCTLEPSHANDTHICWCFRSRHYEPVLAPSTGAVESADERGS